MDASLATVAAEEGGHRGAQNELTGRTTLETEAGEVVIYCRASPAAMNASPPGAA